MLKFLFWITFPAICTGISLSLEPSEREIIINAGGHLELTCTGDTPMEWYHPSYDSSGLQDEKSNRTIINRDMGGRNFMTQLVLSNAYYMDTGYYICHPEGDPDFPKSPMTYVYVKDEFKLLAVNETMGFLHQQHYRNLTIPCRPTSPDVNVTLLKESEPVTKAEYDPHRGFLLKEVKILDTGHYVCEAFINGSDEIATVYFTVIINTHSDGVNKPYINYTQAEHVMVGQTALLDCSVSTELGVVVTLDWVVPNPERQASGNVRRLKGTTDKVKNAIYEHKVLVIENVTLEDSGLYICNVTDSSHYVNQAEHRLVVYTKEMPYLNLTLQGTSKRYIALAGQRTLTWIVKISSYPRPTKIIWFFKQGEKKKETTVEENDKYKILVSEIESRLTVNELNINDSGTYQLFVDNGAAQSTIDLELLVEAQPSMELLKPKLPNGTFIDGKTFFKEGEQHIISCIVVGYPLPNITWYFQLFDSYPNVSEDWNLIPVTEYENEMVDSVRMESKVHIIALASGVVHCKACNKFDCHADSLPFLVSDVARGFDIWGDTDLVSGDNTTLYCGTSIYDSTPNLMWSYALTDAGEFKPINNSNNVKISRIRTKFSYQIRLDMTDVTTDMKGSYKCESDPIDAIITSMNVTRAEHPHFVNGTSLKNATKSVSLGESFNWLCNVTGSPEPRLYWYQNGREITEVQDLKLEKKHKLQLRNGNRTLHFHGVSRADEGTYTCKAVNRLGTVTSYNTLRIDPDSAGPNSGTISYFWMTIFGILVFSFAVVVAFLICRVKRERELRKELTKSVLEHFDEGAEGSINPELGVVEQADLLPYKLKFEFPRDKLKLGKQLGSGAFGVVLKAEAEGILEEEVVTTVAVKMLKQNVDISHFKALTTELKIMIHLGQHLNVVNLLGACTRNLNNRELLVIVEYCRYGNLLNYLQRHRETFINQVNAQTGTFDPAVIASSSSASPKQPKYVNLPNFSFRNGVAYASNGKGRLGSASSNQTDDRQQQNTEMTAVSTPIGEDGYLICREPPMEYKNSNQPICTQDLFCWSFQVARGMEYLASRKILHGDLAARNILLADNNIVKICDFGLSKNMYLYKNDNYFKKGKRLLPVKWMALEAIRDRNFSIQSDVWAYGIVLWELFSLARTPYPGLEDAEKLYHKLEQGYRMEKPEFATNALYEVMLACWNTRPSKRPSFTELAENLGDMLEDSVRKHYVDLNDPFLKQNAEFLSQQDYLSMLKSPDYANLNGEAGDENGPGTSGYICMKRKNRDAQEETELRPMLDGAGAITGSVSDTDSVPNTPSATMTSPPTNFVTVAEATESCGFSNPTYLNLGRPAVHPYMNAPNFTDKETKPFEHQWNNNDSPTE